MSTPLRRKRDQPETDQLRPVLAALIRRHDNPRVDFPRSVSPHPLYGSLLDCPQQLGLCGRSQVGDLVEEKGSAAGQFKLSAAPTYAGRGAVLDPE